MDEECMLCVSISEVILESDGFWDGVVFGKDRGFVLKIFDCGNKFVVVGFGESVLFLMVFDFGWGVGVVSLS